jgi:hypothetical protein
MLADLVCPLRNREPPDKICRPTYRTAQDWKGIYHKDRYPVAQMQINITILDIQGKVQICCDRLCGLVVRVLGYRSGGPGSIPGTTTFSGKKKRKTVVGLERGPISLVSTN